MAETVQGGAYQSVSGEWHDANGEPLSKDAAGRAEKHAAERLRERDLAERQFTEMQAARDPVVQALRLQQLTQQQSVRGGKE